MATRAPSLAALLAPLHGRVSLLVSRPTDAPRSLRTRFAWINVRVSHATEDDDNSAVTVDALALQRDALALLVATLQCTNGRKSEWMAVFASLQLHEGDAWDEIEERGELQVQLRIMGDQSPQNLRILLGLDDHGQRPLMFEQAMRELRIPERATGHGNVPFCVAARAPLEATERDDEYATTYLTEMLQLVHDVNDRSTMWTLQELELDFEHLPLDVSTLPLLEALCERVATVASLRVRVPLTWPVTAVYQFLQRLDQCAGIRALTVRFGKTTHLSPIVGAVSSMANVGSVELVQSTGSRAHGAGIRHDHDVDLTLFFRPAAPTTAPLSPVLRCAEWSLHPVQVAHWFWSPLDLHPQSRVVSLDLEVDAMRLVTLVAALEQIGPALRSLRLRRSMTSSWSSASSRRPEISLPLDAFLTDCPHLETLEIRGRFQMTSLSEVVARYATHGTRIQSLAIVGAQFDDGLTPGLMAMAHELTNRDSEMARHLKELHVGPVGTLEDAPQLVDAIVRMLHTNRTIEMLVLQDESGTVPAVLWPRIQSLHLRSVALTLYAFLSVVRFCQRDDDSDTRAQDATAITGLSCDTLTTIFRFVERPVRRKLRQCG